MGLGFPKLGAGASLSGTRPRIIAFGGSLRGTTFLEIHFGRCSSFCSFLTRLLKHNLGFAMEKAGRTRDRVEEESAG